MKIVPTSTLLQNQYTYNILNEIKVNIQVKENPYHLPFNILFEMAARKNKKRGFLFVSKLLGKHIPVDPMISMLTSAALATLFLEKVYQINHPNKQHIIDVILHNKKIKPVYQDVFNNRVKLPKKTIFIGFAETATALGHAMYECFTNAYYVHTTREDVDVPYATVSFEEEHSHATSQRCYADQKVFEMDSPIVLVDDEITTGKTALNIIESLHKKFPRKEYSVVSILDWRSDEDKQRYRNLEKQLGITIHTVSLLSGMISVEGEPIEVEPKINQNQSPTISPQFHRHTAQSFEYLFQTKNYLTHSEVGDKKHQFYLTHSGRFGISSDQNHHIDDLVNFTSNKLQKKRFGTKTLVLGTGEYMYIPMRIAAELGEGISYQSTTRSPIHRVQQEEYGVQDGISFPSFDDPSVMNYLYNVSQFHYDEIIVFLERSVDEPMLTPFLEQLKMLNIPHIHIVEFLSKYKEVRT